MCIPILHLCLLFWFITAGCPTKVVPVQTEISMVIPILNSTGISYYPDHLRSLEAPLGKSLNASRRGGLATNKADVTRWWRILRQLKDHSKESLTIIFLGSSMLAGHMENLGGRLKSCGIDCDNVRKTISVNADCRPCSYAAYFEKYLIRAYPEVNITIFNWGIVGCGSKCSLIQRGPRISQLKHIDVVFLDFKTNDWCKPNNYDIIALHYEQLVRFLLMHTSAPAVIPISILKTSSELPPDKQVSRYYKLPVIDVENNCFQANYYEQPRQTWLATLSKQVPCYLFGTPLVLILLGFTTRHWENSLQSCGLNNINAC